MVKSEPNADFHELARQKLEAVMPPDPERLNELAVSRARTIAKYLVEKGIDLSRLYILAPEVNTANENETLSALSLNVAH